MVRVSIIVAPHEILLLLQALVTPKEMAGKEDPVSQDVYGVCGMMVS